MLPVDFEGTNLQLNKPESMTDEQCMSIRAYHGYTDDGRLMFLTAWKPNKEDIEAMQRGEPIYIRYISNYFPPTSVFTFDEKGEIN